MDSREKEGGKIEEERSQFVAFLMLNSYFKLNDEEVMLNRYQTQYNLFFSSFLTGYALNFFTDSTLFGM